MNLQKILFDNGKVIYDYLWTLILYLLISVVVCVYVERTWEYDRDTIYLVGIAVTIILRHLQWMFLTWLDPIAIAIVQGEQNVPSKSYADMRLYEKYITTYKGKQFEVEKYPIIFTIGEIDEGNLNVIVHWIKDGNAESTYYSLFDVINLFEKGSWTLYKK